MQLKILTNLLLCSTTLWGAAQPNQPNLVLWYRQQATNWLQAMPLGNGMIGAMVFGRVPQERISLNESSFWSGRPHNYDDPEAFKYLAQIRDLVFTGKFQEAEKIVNDFPSHVWCRSLSQNVQDPLFAGSTVKGRRLLPDPIRRAAS